MKHLGFKPPTKHTTKKKKEKLEARNIEMVRSSTTQTRCRGWKARARVAQSQAEGEVSWGPWAGKRRRRRHICWV
jgi:hypothetical protein